MNGIPILHSGSEFREATLVKVTLNADVNNEFEDSTVDDKLTEWKFVGRRVTCELKQYLVTGNIFLFHSSYFDC